uniref:Coiled-coil domain-containing protein 160 n=1 Tax=Caenorhabditis tropicalis TaxID=1561998 RepID=A0A1I7T0H4_9PELO
MDLLDLYHAHDLSLATPDNYDVHFTKKEVEEAEIRENSSPDSKGKVKKTRIVPWEPYKAAVAHNKKGDACPEKLPELIAYAMNSKSEQNNNVEKRKELRDERKHRLSMEPMNSSEKEMEMEKELDLLRKELNIEQKMNSELKRLMIATLSDELQGQVEALTEDKVRLAHRVDEYMGKLMVEDEESDRLRIDRDVWKCKFLAQSIRCDELTLKNNYLLKTLVGVQEAVRTKNVTSEEGRDFVQLDLQPLFHRSPCEDRVRPISAKYTNLTISCCRNCKGRDIQLL